MSKFNLTKIIKTLSASVNRHAPSILIGVGITGMITTTIMAVKVTPKALSLLQDKKKKLKTEYLTKKEIIQTAWKCYITSALTGLASTACLIFANSINGNRSAALATACTLTETAFKDYKESVVRTVGAEKATDIQNAVSKDLVERNPGTNKEVIVLDADGVLCCEPISKRYFKSTINVIDRAINHINRETLCNMYASLNDFYYEIGLEGTDYGDIIGWNSDKGLIEISYSSQITKDVQPCLVLEYNIQPFNDYNKLY